MDLAGCLDIERLAEPVVGGDVGPAGLDLRADPSATSPYRALKALYKKAREAEDRAARMQLASPDDPDFVPPATLRSQAAELRREVLADAKDLLASRSKDFEVATWVIDTVTREEGFSGLRVGLRLANELAERYWDDLHPRADAERGFAPRVATLRGLIGGDKEGSLVLAVRRLPLVRDGEREMSFADAMMDHEAFDQISKGADSAQIMETAETIEACLVEIRRMEALLDEQCGVLDGEAVAPSFRNLREVLTGECMTVLRPYLPADTTGVGADVLHSHESLNGVGAPAVRGQDGVAGSREEALRQVLRAADYFHRTEPHSPVSYALKEVVRWGRTPLPELMAELVDDDSDRKWFFKMVGVKHGDSASG